MPTHAEKRVLPYTPAQMFDLVAAVEHYAEFLPWCQATRIRQRSDDHVVADMVIGYKAFRERFTSRARFDRRHGRIDVSYQEGPFKYLNNHWVFRPVGGGESCEVDFFIDFEFRSRLMQSVIQGVFNEAVKRMVNAFETRAAELYASSAGS